MACSGDNCLAKIAKVAKIAMVGLIAALAGLPTKKLPEAAMRLREQALQDGLEPTTP